MIEYLLATMGYLGIGLLLVWRDRYLREVSIHPWLEYSLSILSGIVAGLVVQYLYDSVVFGAIAALIAACGGILTAEGLHKFFSR